MMKLTSALSHTVFVSHGWARNTDQIAISKMLPAKMLSTKQKSHVIGL